MCCLKEKLFACSAAILILLSAAFKMGIQSTVVKLADGVDGHHCATESFEFLL
jgi:hypothetical protein